MKKSKSSSFILLLIILIRLIFWTKFYSHLKGDVNLLLAQVCCALVDYSKEKGKLDLKNLLITFFTFIASFCQRQFMKLIYFSSELHVTFFQGFKELVEVSNFPYFWYCSMTKNYDVCRVSFLFQPQYCSSFE